MSRVAGLPGRITVVSAATGGCGATTVATNLAYALTEGDRQVCLVDLDFAHHGAAGALDISVQPVSFGATLDTWFGLRCVVAPPVPMDPGLITSDRVAQVLAGLTEKYDHVVVDAPADLSGPSLAALDLAVHQVLVTTPERPALVQLRELLDVFDLLGYQRNSRSILVNRAQTDLTEVEIDNLLRSPVAEWLPYTARVPWSVNRGAPLAVLEPDEPFVRAVRRFALALGVGRSPPGP